MKLNISLRLVRLVKQDSLERFFFFSTNNSNNKSKMSSSKAIPFIPPPPPGGKPPTKRNPFLRAAEKRASTEGIKSETSSPRLTLENLYVTETKTTNNKEESMHRNNNNNDEEEDDDDDDVEVVDEDTSSGAKSSKSKKAKQTVALNPPPPPRPPPPKAPVSDAPIVHTKDKIDMYLAQRKQDLMREEQELAAAADFDARRQSNMELGSSFSTDQKTSETSTGVSYDESYTQLYRKSSSDTRSEMSFVIGDGFAPEGDASVDPQQWEPAAEEEKAKYLSQRYLMLQKRASMEVSDLEELIGNWNGQTELIKEVHNAIFQADLQRFKNIRQKFNNFAFMRDATLNTVFHTAAINPNLTILAALGNCLDSSEFGTKVFPETPSQDKALVKDVYQQAQLWRNTTEKSTTPCFKAGMFLYTFVTTTSTSMSS